jgi:hypothetical protein
MKSVTTKPQKSKHEDENRDLVYEQLNTKVGDAADLVFDHWRKRNRYRWREKISENKQAVGHEMVDWLAGLGWQFRIDLTFRVGTKDCEIARLSPRSAVRRLDHAKARLARQWGRPLTILGCLEYQQRGIPHFHCLIKTTDGGRAPFMTFDQFCEWWRHWQAWPPRRRVYGVEGSVHLQYLNGLKSIKKSVKYVVKYVVKAGSDSLWILDGEPTTGMAADAKRFEELRYGQRVFRLGPPGSRTK